MKIGRLLGAGLLAGLVLTIGEAVLQGVRYADATAAAMRSLGHEISGAGADTAKLVGITFVQGVLGMLTYAGVAPRWGAGPARRSRRARPLGALRRLLGRLPDLGFRRTAAAEPALAACRMGAGALSARAGCRRGAL
jgi:hypothetical protein